MKAYNLYYKSKLINRIPMDINTIKKVLEEEYIYKKGNLPDEVLKIPTQQIVVKECTILK